MLGLGPDASHRNRDQPRLGIGSVLGYDEGAAVGCVAALLRRIGARVKTTEVAGVSPFRHGDRAGLRREAEVRETERRQRDEHERNDSRGAEESGRRGFHERSFRRRGHATTLGMRQ
jgi:hypothetical protein